MTASEEAEIAGKRKPRTQTTNPPAKFLQRCAERTQKTARRSGVKFGGIIQTASEDEGLLARKGIERRRQAPRTISKKLCKCVQKTLHTLKNTPEMVCFLVELLTTRKGGEIACKKRRRPQATSAPHGCKPCISFHCKMK